MTQIAFHHTDHRVTEIEFIVGGKVALHLVAERDAICSYFAGFQYVYLAGMSFDAIEVEYKNDHLHIATVTDDTAQRINELLNSLGKDGDLPWRVVEVEHESNLAV